MEYRDIRPGLHTYRQIPCGKERGRNGRLRVTTRGVSYIQTSLGELPETEWVEEAYQAVVEHGDLELLEQIEIHVREHCAWLKDKDIRPYSLECLLNEAYRSWDGFDSQREVLFIL